MIRYNEPGISEIEKAMQETAHRFAVEVMRPTGIALDKMSAAEVIAPGSAYWQVHKQYRQLGLNLVEVSADLSPVECARLAYIVNEELGYGDLGLGWGCYAATFPAALARATGRADLQEIFTFDQIGCWGITEPDHGSDMLDFTGQVSPPPGNGSISNCVAVRRGDKIAINGQKSNWVSNGSVAETMSLFCRYDDGSRNNLRAAFLVPLNLPGISRGTPLHKMGVRSLTDAEIFFDNVEIPASYMVVPPEMYTQFLAGTLIGANPGMAVYMVGMARAAYEFALDYSKERKQGGRPIFEYPTVRIKLFEVFRKINAARALCRHAMVAHAQTDQPYFPLAASAKVTCTQLCMEAVNGAFEIFGGNAQTEDYPIEKLYRDARLGTIADGTNDVLSLMASLQL